MVIGLKDVACAISQSVCNFYSPLPSLSLTQHASMSARPSLPLPFQSSPSSSSFVFPFENATEAIKPTARAVTAADLHHKSLLSPSL